MLRLSLNELRLIAKSRGIKRYKRNIINETSLPEKEYFYVSLSMKDITDVGHRHQKRVFKKFHNKNACEYHDLYVQSDTLILADVFENFGNKYIEIYEVDPAYFCLHLD